MSVLTSSILLAILLPPILWFALRAMRKRHRAWNDLARRLGLTPRVRRFRLFRQMNGTIDGCKVTIEIVDRRQFIFESTEATRIEVTPPQVMPSLGIARRGAWTAIESVVQNEELTGDPTFDARVSLRGNTPQVRAMMGADARKRVLDALHCDVAPKHDLLNAMARHVGESQVEVVHGVWRYTFPTEVLTTSVDDRVSWLIENARTLASGAADIPAALAAHVEADPEPGVRQRCLETLARAFHDTPAAQRAGLAMLDVPDVALRLVAAELAGGDRAREVLTALVGDKDLEPAHRLAALELLTRDHPYGALGSTLDAAVRSGKPALVASAVTVIGRARDASRLATLRELASAMDAEVALQVARALGKIQDPSTEPELLRLLEHASIAVQRAAAVGLGRVGSVGAVEPLLRRAQGVFTDLDLKRDARDAIARIQNRLGPVDAGRLTVADGADAAGGLSVAVEPGRLSLADTDPKG